MAREENTAILEIERNFYKNIDEKKRKRENDEEDDWQRKRMDVKMASELITLKSKISDLELKLKFLKDEMAEQVIKHRQEIDKLKSCHKIEKKKDEDERVEAGRLVQKCQGLMEENGCMKDQISGLSSQLKSKQMEFSKQSLEKDLKYEEERERWGMERMGLVDECGRLRSEGVLVREEKEEMRKKIQSMQSKSDEWTAWQHEKQDMQDRISLLQHQLNQQEMDKSRRERSDEGRQVEKLQREIDYLKMMRQNDTLLHEKVNSYEAKLHRLANRNKNMEAVEEENKKLRKSLEEYEEMVHKIPNVNSGSEVVTLVQKLRTECQYLSVCKGDVEGRLKTAEADVERLSREVDRLTDDVSTRRHDNHLLKNKLHNIDNKVSLLTVERDKYKMYIDSNLSFGDLPQVMVGKVEMLEEIKKRLESHVTSQEQTCAKLQTRVEELEERLQKATFTTQQPPPSSSSSSVDVEALKTKISQLESEKKALAYEASRSKRMGLYDPCTTKVITVLDNPFTQKRRSVVVECQSLRQENQLLKTKLKLAKEGSEDLTVRSSKMIASIGTVEEQLKLKQQLQSHELMMKRLTENYEEVSDGFKRLISALLGYRIERVAKRKYKVTNNMSQEPDHCFIFEETKEGDLQLILNEYLKENFRDLIDKHITSSSSSSSSYPLFMAAVNFRLHQT